MNHKAYYFIQVSIIFCVPDKISAAESNKAFSAGKAKSTPDVKQNKPKPNSGRKRRNHGSCHDTSGIHFSHVGRYEPTVGDTGVNRETEANGNIVSRMSCHAP